MVRHGVFATLAVAACCLCLLAAAKGQDDQPRDRGVLLGEFKPVMPVPSLMIEQERHFKAMLKLLRDPEQKEWTEQIVHEALALAEMANINGYQENARKHDAYRRLAAQLKEQSIQFAELATAKKVKQAKHLFSEINATCSACHDAFH